jgi:hypothetical protein
VAATRIAILGWGSLVWDPRSLAYDQQAGWRRGGPILPLEFSRRTKDGRLALVLDDQNGVAAPVRSAISTLTAIEDSIENLRSREGTTTENIGFLDLGSGQGRTRLPPIRVPVSRWGRMNGFSHVIWTDLAPSPDFSSLWGIQYLESLGGVTLQRAREYFVNAPEEVQTPLREAMRQRGWIHRAA